MNVVLAAEESAGLQMLRALLRSNHRVAAVLAAPPAPAAAGVSVWKAAADAGVETWPAKMVKYPSLAERLRQSNVDLLLNVHSLYIINREVLAAPKLGTFNLHPGPLPRYAGLNAVSWAIFAGEREHGVTVHKVEPAIDTGPIVYQSLFPIEDCDTGLSLSLKCVREGVALMLRLVEAAASDPARIPLLPQDLRAREYFGRQVPENGRICWAWPAQKIINFVRACDYFPFRSPWGHPWTHFRGEQLSVVKAFRTGRRCDATPGTIEQCSDKAILVACQDEWISVEKVKIGDKYLSPADIVHAGDVLTNVR